MEVNIDDLSMLDDLAKPIDDLSMLDDFTKLIPTPTSLPTLWGFGCGWLLVKIIKKEKKSMKDTLRIHPENSKIFEFRGKPLVLICATEHYGAVMNRPFDFRKYLADAAEKKQTLTRLFVLFRELQTSCNPYSTCKPESPDYIAPFSRVDPETAPFLGIGPKTALTALDGQPKFDLDRWNPEFFERLHEFLALASEYGIIVEITMLSNTYNNEIWALNPLNTSNNINDVEVIEPSEYITLRHPKLFARQKLHISKIVSETNKYDNIIYEVCNEPGGYLNGANNEPTPYEVNEWQKEIIKVIRDCEANLPNKHLISCQEAFTWNETFKHSTDLAFDNLNIDVVNIHPLPNTVYREKGYDLGNFMSKQLKLEAIRDICLAAYKEVKPLNMDEDNVASQYKDYDGWTIHRKRAWTTIFCGSHYDYIDFSIINYCEAGTPASQKHIRSWMKNLSEFIHSLDLVRSKPITGLIKEKPQYTVESVLAVENSEYCVYLADSRELGECGSGTPIRGSIIIDLPQGSYKVSCYSPVSGLYSPAVEITGGKDMRVELPEFVNDIVVIFKN